MKKRILFVSLSIIWMIVIFMFSNQNGETSGGLSDKIVSVIIKIIYGKQFSDFDLSKQNEIQEVISFIIRKGAHFTIFGILATFYYFMLTSFKKNEFNYLISLALTFIYACSDEWHQSFVGGRAPQIRDVLIDTTGGIVFLLVIWLISFILDRRKKHVR